MQALEAVHIIRSWALPKLSGLAICDDTPRFNILVQLFDRMAARVEQSGESLRRDLYDLLHQELALQLAPHHTTIKRLQDGYDELCRLVDNDNAPQPEDKE